MVILEIGWWNFRYWMWINGVCFHKNCCWNVKLSPNELYCPKYGLQANSLFLGCYWWNFIEWMNGICLIKEIYGVTRSYLPLRCQKQLLGYNCSILKINWQNFTDIWDGWTEYSLANNHLSECQILDLSVIPFQDY